MERKGYWRRGAVILVAAFSLYLFLGNSGSVAGLLDNPELVSFLVYMETGRLVRIPEILPPEETQPPQTEPALPTEDTRPLPTEPVRLTFGSEDAQLVEVSNLCGYQPDLQQLLQMALDWDLTQEGPSVLILHTHATESYTQTTQESYVPSSLYRTLDAQHNMLRVGEVLAQTLESYGIQVIHDKTLHDHPSYTASYSNARKTIETYLEQHPTLRVVLDVHRDALELTGNTQLRTQATVDGESSAQIMMVVGTDAGGLYHPQWQENMAFAVKLHTQLEKRWPGICRPINFRTERFNQDLSTGALIIEVGANGNTLEEAMVAAQALAQGIADLANGTARINSTSS